MVFLCCYLFVFKVSLLVVRSWKWMVGPNLGLQEEHYIFLTSDSLLQPVEYCNSSEALIDLEFAV